MAQTGVAPIATTDPLQALLAIEAIRNLIARYAQHVAQGEGVQVSRLFIEDGVYRTSLGPAGETRVEGRDALAANLTHLRLGTAVPLVTNIIINLDGDRATGSSTLFSPRSPAARGGSPTRPFFGVYRDSYALVDGSWHFVERHFTYFPPLE